MYSFSDPCWASINRGILICDECCSVHRSLGRHISQVRHLKHTPWPPTLLQVKSKDISSFIKARISLWCFSIYVYMYIFFIVFYFSCFCHGGLIKSVISVSFLFDTFVLGRDLQFFFQTCAMHLLQPKFSVYSEPLFLVEMFLWREREF